ncbi:MAG: hypothetical protein RR091_01080 [Cloacibacillus sp.]
MRSFDITEMKRAHLMAAGAAVVFAVALQFILMQKLASAYQQLDLSYQEAQVQRAAMESRADAVLQYKSLVKIDDKGLPGPVESPNKFYSVLLGLLSSQSFDDADVTKAEETEQNTSFKVAGVANYNQLLHLLASLRQGSYMMRVTELSIEGMTNNEVKYGFTVSAMVSPPAAAAVEAAK